MNHEIWFLNRVKIGNDCFNVDALGIMLKVGFSSYVVPTLAYLGLCLLPSYSMGMIILPVTMYFGGLFYFFIMAAVFRDLETNSRK